MKLFKCFVLALFIITLFQFNLFSTITSRIEGVVIDAETNLPLEGTKIELFFCIDMLRFKVDEEYPPSDEYANHWGRSVSNDKGYFRFDNLKKGTYYIFVSKAGYSNYAPFYDIYNYIKNHFIGNLDIPKNTDLIKLKEGQIKHVKVKLDSEAILKVKITRKYPAGISIQKRWDNDVVIKHPSFLYSIRSECEEECIINGLKAGSVEMKIYPEDYIKFATTIQLEKGKTTIYEHIVDYTQGQVVYGNIRLAEGNLVPPNRIDISFTTINQDFRLACMTDRNGRFCIGGLKPGDYKVRIFNVRTEKKIYSTINIKENERIELNRNI